MTSPSALSGLGAKRWPWGGLCLVLWACGDPHSSPTVGSNTNWLKACDTTEQCGRATACHCGACTAECNSDADCAALSGARCAAATDPATWSACQTVNPTFGICLPRCQPGECGDGQVCVDGACVLEPVPNNSFCAPVATPATADRTSAEQLLDALQSTRTAGGVTCGSSTPTAAVPALRMDARLLCEARVFAADVAVTRTNSSLVDSQGRTTQDRLNLAGYTGRTWAEAYVLRGPAATDALNLMLGDAAICADLTNSRYQDVGIGSSGGAYVITLGAP
jgi:uncharacterized protein YkwD